MQRISNEFTFVKRSADAGFNSAILNDAIGFLPTISEDVVGFLEKINPEAAKNDDKYAFFRDHEETDDINEHKLVRLYQIHLARDSLIALGYCQRRA